MTSVPPVDDDAQLVERSDSLVWGHAIDVLSDPDSIAGLSHARTGRPPQQMHCSSGHQPTRGEATMLWFYKCLMGLS